jgi:DNA/RNA endonuclease YhcR with UshA esterase domain
LYGSAYPAIKYFIRENSFVLLGLILVSGILSASAQNTQSSISGSWNESEIITDLSRITNDMDGKNVKIQAKVQDFKPPWAEKAPSTITITDDKTSLPVVFWEDVAPDISRDCFVKGTLIEVGGQIRLYQNEIQIKLSVKRDCYIKIIKPTEGATGSEDDSSLSGGIPATSHSEMLRRSTVPISSIRSDNLGGIVTVIGNVTDYKTPWNERAPYKITVNDGTGDVAVVYWAEVAKGMTVTPKFGDQIQVTGESMDYRGELQLKIRNATAIRFPGPDGVQQTPQPEVQSSAASSSIPASPSDELPPVITRGPNSPSTSWYRSYSTAVQQAKGQGRPMIVYFRKDGLAKCIEFETTVLMSNEFNTLAQNYICMFEDLDQGPLLAYHYGIVRIPHIEILDANGDRIEHFTYNIPLPSLVQVMSNYRK